jgi:type I restriction enzyme R subunit
MNPDTRGKDLRVVFDEPDYRVMLVANKFQTGFDQPKLVAMYVDKKIANEVEIVQTFSRLNRTCPGKEQTFVVDFVNDPETVQKAFKRYDAGAEIDSVEDPNTIYKLKSRLDQAGIYEHQDLEHFLEHFKTLRAEMIRSGRVDEGTHERLYNATQRAADTYNAQLTSVREAIRDWDKALREARANGDEQGELKAEHERKECLKGQEQLTRFKSDLGRFGRQYGYVTQLIEFGDPELENFAGFARLLAKRLDGVPPESVDVSGLTLTAFAIHEEEIVTGDDDEDENTLRPTDGGSPGEPDGETKARLSELISAMNETFGEMTTPREQAAFVNAMAETIEKNPHVTAQVKNNPQDQAMQGDMPDAVREAILRVVTDQSQRQEAFQSMGELLLSRDTQAMDKFLGLLYEMVKDGERIEV